LRREIFGPARDQGTGQWGKLYEERCEFYFSLNIIRMIKLRRIRWVGNIAHMGDRGVHTEFWWENLREGDSFDDLRLHGSIILKCIFINWDGAGT